LTGGSSADFACTVRERRRKPEQYAGVSSIDRAELLANVTLLGRAATAFELPSKDWLNDLARQHARRPKIT
jgi:hypothetical protein